MIDVKAIVAIFVLLIGSIIGVWVYDQSMNVLEKSTLVQNAPNGQQTWEQLQSAQEQKDNLEEAKKLENLKPNRANFDVLIYGLPIALILGLIGKATGRI